MTDLLIIGGGAAGLMAAGAACARFIHAQFLTACQIENFGVFAAELNGSVDRMSFAVFCDGILQILRGGDYFLYETDAETFAQEKRSRSCQSNAGVQMRKRANQILQKRNKCGGHCAGVSLIGVCQNGAVGTEQDVFDGGTAQVNAQAKCF